MTPMTTKAIETSKKTAKRLASGDKVLSATGRILVVSKIIQKENKTVIIFDGDMEIDVDPYIQMNVVVKN